MSDPWLWFWQIIVAVCLIWYSTATVYVAVRGFADIRGMLARLRDEGDAADLDVPSGK